MEIYLGPDADRKYIRTHLENIRILDPIEITTLPKVKCLSDSRVAAIINIDQFREVAYRCLAQVGQRYGIDIESVEERRYYTVLPPEKDDIGGFHDARSLGYQYWYHASFVVALNSVMVSVELRTLEMVRNFLHDCLHHSIFRSYRRAMRVPATSPSATKHRIPEVYREQYGINFRNRDGMSYSSPELTARSPETINLNLLMDGVIVLVVAESLKELALDINCTSRLEEQIRNEILLESFDAGALPRAYHFNTQVTEPSRKFVTHWGKDEMTLLILQAMMSGDLVAIKRFFKERTGIENGWEKLFKRPDFSLPENPNA